MKEITANPDLVARCGLYCGACKAYLTGHCPGCRENTRAGWCPQRKCCGQHEYSTCADCQQYPEARDCPYFKSFIAKVMSLVFNSDRPAALAKIRELGPAGFASWMAERKLARIPRRR
jgi:hypothetical protein